MARRSALFRPFAALSVLTVAVLTNGLITAGPSLADPPGSNGTVKIDGVPTDAGNDNDPHPGCNFTVELFGFDAGATTGSVVFNAHPPTSGGSLTFPIGFTAPTRTNGNTFDYGKTFDISSLIATLTPQKNQGYHIKTTVSVVEPNGRTVSKTKVYWVDKCAPPTRIPVFVGYADDGVGRGSFVPSPWLGDSNTNFVGIASAPRDAGAIELVNNTGSPITGVNVTVTIGATLYDIWGTQMIPANGNLVLTQMQPDAFGVNDPPDQFDTSEDPSQGTCAAPSTVIPIIHVTINGVTTNYLDSHQVLLTGGVDSALCNNNANEGIPFTATT